MLLTGPPMVGVSGGALAATGTLDATTTATLGTMLQQAARMVIVIVIIVRALELVKNVFRQALRRR